MKKVVSTIIFLLLLTFGVGLAYHKYSEAYTHKLKPIMPNKTNNNENNKNETINAINNTKDKVFISAKTYQKILGVGIDVDWMSFPRVHRYYFYWRSKGVSVPKYFKEEGFSNVRIRVSQDVISNKTALTQLKEIVNDCLKVGLIPIITYTAPELRNNPTSREAQDHFVIWWKTVAECFKGSSYLLSYDLLIESSGKIKDHPEVLNEVYNRTISEIREIDPKRIIIITPAHVSKPSYLKYLNISNDGYLLAEWHIYAGGPKHGMYNATYINESIELALNWSNKTKIPTWVGAWRPYWISKKDKEIQSSIDEDIKFSKFMVQSLQNAGIPYDINADSGFFNIENLSWIKDREIILNIILEKEN